MQPRNPIATVDPTVYSCRVSAIQKWKILPTVTCHSERKQRPGAIAAGAMPSSSSAPLLLSALLFGRARAEEVTISTLLRVPSVGPTPGLCIFGTVRLNLRAPHPAMASLTVTRPVRLLAPFPLCCGVAVPGCISGNTGCDHTAARDPGHHQRRLLSPLTH